MKLLLTLRLGYVSLYGGATPEHPCAFDYATRDAKLEKNRWYILTFTYDGEQIKVYVNDKLDANGNNNPRIMLRHYELAVFLIFRLY